MFYAHGSLPGTFGSFTCKGCPETGEIRTEKFTNETTKGLLTRNAEIASKKAVSERLERRKSSIYQETRVMFYLL